MTSTEKMEEILEEAKQAVSVQRNAAYGEPEDNHERTAMFWSCYIGQKCIIRDGNSMRVQITARDVCWLNVLQKISRDIHGVSRDNAVDVIGYAANAHACANAHTDELTASEAWAEVAS